MRKEEEEEEEAQAAEAAEAAEAAKGCREAAAASAAAAAAPSTLEAASAAQVLSPVTLSMDAALALLPLLVQSSIPGLDRALDSLRLQQPQSPLHPAQAHTVPRRAAAEQLLQGSPAAAVATAAAASSMDALLGCMLSMGASGSGSLLPPLPSASSSSLRSSSRSTEPLPTTRSLLQQSARWE